MTSHLLPQLPKHRSRRHPFGLPAFAPPLLAAQRLTQQFDRVKRLPLGNPFLPANIGAEHHRPVHLVQRFRVDVPFRPADFDDVPICAWPRWSMFTRAPKG